MGIVFLNLFSCAYVISSKPFALRSDNWIEVFNEFMGLQISILLLYFLKSDDTDEIFIMGLFGNLLLLSMVGINIVFIMISAVWQIRLRCTKKNNISNDIQMKEYYA